MPVARTRSDRSIASSPLPGVNVQSLPTCDRATTRPAGPSLRVVWALPAAQQQNAHATTSFVWRAGESAKDSLDRGTRTARAAWMRARARTTR